MDSYYNKVESLEDELYFLSFTPGGRFRAIDEERRIYEMELRSRGVPSVFLEVTFPKSYPSKCPLYCIVAPWMRPQTRKKMKRELRRIYRMNKEYFRIEMWTDKIQEMMRDEIIELRYSSNY